LLEDTTPKNIVKNIVKMFQFFKYLKYLNHSKCGAFNATNASKHLINQSKEKILQIDRSKNASKHL